MAHKPRPIPLSARADLKKLLDKLVCEGIMQSTDSSEWVSPIVVVRKKNGDIRLCAELRTLNKNILVDCYPLPKICYLQFLVQIIFPY